MSKTKSVIQFRCIDFKVSDYKDDSFKIQIFGIDENRKSYSLRIDDFKPYFYIKVGDDWTDHTVKEFFEYIKENNSDDYALIKSMKDNIDEIKLVKHKTLYNFDNNKLHKFIYISCHNISLFYKIKNLYYDKETQKLNSGVEFNGTKTKLYEIMIPPMLRFFHLQNISPSGWIEIQKYNKVPKKLRQTNVDIEILCKFKDVISLPEKEDVVPYKICSFDIEASSSHGDFPTPKKDYKKVAYDIIEYFTKHQDSVDEYGYEMMLKNALMSSFGLNYEIPIDICHLKEKNYDNKMFDIQFKKFIGFDIVISDEDFSELDNTIHNYFDIYDGVENDANNQEVEDDYRKRGKSKKVKKSIKSNKIIEILENSTYDNKIKTGYLMTALNQHFPEIEGDYVTFIGSTFVNYGEEFSNMNHLYLFERYKKFG